MVLIHALFSPCSFLLIAPLQPYKSQLINMVDVSKKTCPSENVPDNFMYYQAQDPTPPGLGLGVVPPPPSRTPFPNQDASFLVACVSNRPQYVRSSDLVVLARGYLPRTPGGFDDAPFVGDLLVSALKSM